jgi:glycosyltransferase involved in cell wall biosynthesis
MTERLIEFVMPKDFIAHSAPTQPLVSALVTVHNREAILRETVKSLQNSTIANFEIILVDDKSSDASWEVCTQLQNEDPRIRAYRNPENLGDYPNRNRAASFATGRYLKYLDADDLIYPHSLQIMVEAMEAHPEAAVAMSVNVIDPPTPYPECITPAEFFARHFLQRSPLGAGPSAAMIRRTCFESVGGFSGEQFIGDTELWLRLAENWPIILLQPALVWWRRHPDQQMTEELRRPEVLNLRFRLQQNALRSTSFLTQQEKRVAEARLRRNHARRLLSFGLRQRRPKIAWSLIMSSGITLKDIATSLRGYS